MLPSLVYILLTLLPVSLTQKDEDAGEYQLAYEANIGAISHLHLVLIPGHLVLNRWQVSLVETLQRLATVANRFENVHLYILISFFVTSFYYNDKFINR